MKITVHIENGKYTYEFNEETGELIILRYGEYWKDGTKFDLCSMQEIKRLQTIIENRESGV